MRLGVILATAVLSLLPLSPIATAEAPPAEKQKIETLIGKVEALAGATFIRNGSDYDAKTAAKFLRAKWGRSNSEIKTASDFIAKAGTASGTSGKPYLIRMADGKQIACSEFLKAKLAKLDAPQAK